MGLCVDGLRQRRWPTAQISTDLRCRQVGSGQPERHKAALRYVQRKTRFRRGPDPKRLCQFLRLPCRACPIWQGDGYRLIPALESDCGTGGRACSFALPPSGHPPGLPKDHPEIPGRRQAVQGQTTVGLRAIQIVGGVFGLGEEPIFRRQQSGRLLWAKRRARQLTPIPRKHGNIRRVGGVHDHLPHRIPDRSHKADAVRQHGPIAGRQGQHPVFGKGHQAQISQPRPGQGQDSPRIQRISQR